MDNDKLTASVKLYNGLNYNFESFKKLFSYDDKHYLNLENLCNNYRQFHIDKQNELEIKNWVLQQCPVIPPNSIKNNNSNIVHLWMTLSLTGPLVKGGGIEITKRMASIPAPTEDGEFIIASNGGGTANRYTMEMQLALSPGIHYTETYHEEKLVRICRIIAADSERIVLFEKEGKSGSIFFSSYLGRIDDKEEKYRKIMPPNYPRKLHEYKSIDELKKGLPKIPPLFVSRNGKKQIKRILQGKSLPITEDSYLERSELEEIFKLFLDRSIPVTDDRSLANRTVKRIGDFLYEILDQGMRDFQNDIWERWSFYGSKQEDSRMGEKSGGIESIIPHQSFQSRIDHFFRNSGLFHLLEATNPLAEISQKRRLTMRGPGGIRKKILMLPTRDVHITDFGRICPIETPQGEDLGLNLYLAQDAKIDDAGNILARYKEYDTDKEVYLAPFDETEKKVGVFAGGGAPHSQRSYVRTATEEILPYLTGGDKPTHETGSPCGFLGYSASLIPFLQHNDANRALMGANMMKQALPLVSPEPPLVKTGYERVVAGMAAKESPFLQAGELCLGKNLLVGYLPWDLYTYEDAVVISDRLVRENVLSHIETEEIVLDEKRQEGERVTLENEFLRSPLGESDHPYPGFEHLDQDGVIKKGSPVSENAVLVSRLRPPEKVDTSKKMTDLFLVLFGDSSGQEMEDASLYAPKHLTGTVKHVEWIREGLPRGVSRRVRITIEIQRPIHVGDKISGRHGNKGVVSRILPESEMPYLKCTGSKCCDTSCSAEGDHQHLDILINPLTITGRMNLGQLYETALSWLPATGKGGEGGCLAPPFSVEWTWEKIADALKREGLNWRHPVFFQENGKEEAIRCQGDIHEPVTVGYQYILKLRHLSEDKMKARGEFCVDLATGQPSVPGPPDPLDINQVWNYRIDRRRTPQRLGEMEVWALEGHGAWNILDELLFLKSDADHLRRRAREHFRGEFVNRETAILRFKSLAKKSNWSVEDKEEGVEVKTSPAHEGRLFEMASRFGFHGHTLGRGHYHFSPLSLKEEPREHRAFKTFVLYCRALGLEVEGIDPEKRMVPLVGPDVRGWPELTGVSIRIAGDEERNRWAGDRCVSGLKGQNGLYPRAWVRGDRGSQQEFNEVVSIIPLPVPIDNPLFRRSLEILIGEKKKIFEKKSDDYLYPAKLYEHCRDMDLDEMKKRLESMKKLDADMSRQLELIKLLQEKKYPPTIFFLRNLLVPPRNLRFESADPYPGDKVIFRNDLNDIYHRIMLVAKRLDPNPNFKDSTRVLHDAISPQEQENLRRLVHGLLVNDKMKGILQRPVMRRGGTRPARSLLAFLAGSKSGKQGLFREHLLGKRVDFSGRAVIVPGPELGIDQAGIPFQMGKALFRDVLLGKVIQKIPRVETVKYAGKELERPVPHAVRLVKAKAFLKNLENEKDIRMMLEDIAKDHPILLNRAPSLHRLSILAFYPVFHDRDDVIRLNPFVCTPFNADFDGDTMAVHAPILPESREEALKMLPSQVLRSPANGKLVIDHKKDLALAFHFLQGNTKTAEDLYNQFDEWSLKGPETFSEEIKNLTGFMRNDLKRCGFSLGVEDFLFAENLNEEVKKIEDEYQSLSFKTKKEAIEFWGSNTRRILGILEDTLGRQMFSPLKILRDTKAANVELNQISGIRGIMLRPGGTYTSYPVLSNIVRGMSPLEYFVSCHGSRHGLADKGLMTGPAGALTNVLVQAGNALFISEEDCGTERGIIISAFETSKGLGIKLADRIVGRCLAENTQVAGGRTFQAGHLVKWKDAKEIAESGVKKVRIRSPFMCQSVRNAGGGSLPGICQKCYGVDLATNDFPPVGFPAGIVAAQSIGEPGTQLTLRTFHTGGIAGDEISMGLDAARRFFYSGISKEGGGKLPKNPSAEAAEDILHALQQIYYPECNIADHHFEVVMRAMKEDAGKGAFRTMLQAAHAGSGFLSRLGFRRLRENLSRSSLHKETDFLAGMKERMIVGQVRPTA